MGVIELTELTLVDFIPSPHSNSVRSIRAADGYSIRWKLDHDAVHIVGNAMNVYVPIQRVAWFKVQDQVAEPILPGHPLSPIATEPTSVPRAPKPTGKLKSVK